MAKSITKKKKNGIIMVVVDKLQRSLFPSRKLIVNNANDNKDFDVDSRAVPEDVKEGHFAVVAVNDDGKEPRRFVVPLSCLTHPMFLRLLKEAAEEYGFDHEGRALTIRCKPSEIVDILAHEQWKLESKTRDAILVQKIVFIL